MSLTIAVRYEALIINKWATQKCKDNGTEVWPGTVAIVTKCSAQVLFFFSLTSIKKIITKGLGGARGSRAFDKWSIFDKLENKIQIVNLDFGIIKPKYNFWPCRRWRRVPPARCRPRTPQARATRARWTRSRARRRFGARCAARTPGPPPSPATAATRATPPSSRRSPTPSPSQPQPDTHLLKIIYLVFSVLWIIQPTNQKIRIRVSLKILVKKNKMK